MHVVQSRRVLLVEDDVDLREALVDALTIHGHEVIAATDGREGLRQMRARHPDVVLLDLMMPVMDGWEFRLEQRRDPALAETPVVAISASRSPTAAAVDADFYLEKPFSPDAMLDAIDQVVVARQRRQAPTKAAESDRLSALGTLAAGVAHEINSPLTYVLLKLQSAMRQVGALGQVEHAEAVDHLRSLIDDARAGVQRIQGITGGIRAFARLDDTDGAPLDVREPLESAVRMITPQLARSIRLTTQYGTTPPVRASQARLGQVFINLLSNAAQAVPDVAGARHDIVVTSATTHDGAAVIEISDSGPGIAPHVLGHIFEPFFTTRPAGAGAGLGLSIAHGIVQSLGGRIEVATEVGRGTTVRVVLPPTRPLTHRELDVTRPSTALRRKALVIDAEAAVRDAVREAIRGDHEVTVVDTGARALELLAAGERYDVVICDLDLPAVDGVALYARLARSLPAPAPRLIFLNAGPFSAEAREFLVAGGHPSLQKPIDLDRLHTLLGGG